MGKEFQAKNQGLNLSLGLAKARLSSAGLTASVALPKSDRLEPIRTVLRETLSSKTTGVSERMIRKLSKGC